MSGDAAFLGPFEDRPWLDSEVFGGFFGGEPSIFHFSDPPDA